MLELFHWRHSIDGGWDRCYRWRGLSLNKFDSECYLANLANPFLFTVVLVAEMEDDLKFVRDVFALGDLQEFVKPHCDFRTHPQRCWEDRCRQAVVCPMADRATALGIGVFYNSFAHDLMPLFQPPLGQRLAKAQDRPRRTRWQSSYLDMNLFCKTWWLICTFLFLWGPSCKI
jgi:hypothetical protein